MRGQSIEQLFETAATDNAWDAPMQVEMLVAFIEACAREGHVPSAPVLVQYWAQHPPRKGKNNG